MKTNGNRVQIHTLGRFDICVDGNSVSGQITRSKKLKNLAAYLILNHDRPVPYSELFEVLWPNEESSNPRNALKMLMYRLRNALTDGGAPADMNFVVIQQGTCQWNPFLFCNIDFEEVYDLHSRLQQGAMSSDARMNALARITQLYQGHFLGEHDNEMWAVTQDAYLHNIYLQSVNDLVELFHEEGSHEQIITLCRNALRIDELDEGINRAMILSLAAVGRHTEATQRFSYITELYYTQLGIQLPTEMRELYSQVVDVANNIQMDVDEVCRQLSEPGTPKGAFACEYAIFRDLYRIEARCLERYGGRVFLGLLSITGERCEELPLRQLNKVVSQLMEEMQSMLRKGDIISRFSPSQIVVLLPTVTQETGERVLERIRKGYYRAHPKSRVSIACMLRPILSQQNAKQPHAEQPEPSAETGETTGCMTV